MIELGPTVAADILDRCVLFELPGTKRTDPVPLGAILDMNAGTLTYPIFIHSHIVRGDYEDPPNDPQYEADVRAYAAAARLETWQPGLDYIRRRREGTPIPEPPPEA